MIRELRDWIALTFELIGEILIMVGEFVRPRAKPRHAGTVIGSWEVRKAAGYRPDIKPGTQP